MKIEYQNCNQKNYLEQVTDSMEYEVVDNWIFSVKTWKKIEESADKIDSSDKK